MTPDSRPGNGKGACDSAHFLTASGGDNQTTIRTTAPQVNTVLT
jgi:hypothetical protein